MAVHIILPEFIVDFSGQILKGGIVIKDQKIVAVQEDLENFTAEITRLPNHVIVPGFANCHSHAFQRALRGLVERKPHAGSGDNFFTWRESMYRVANALTPHEMELIALLTYIEMLEAGFTHVGEFHYVHHDVGGAPYPDALAMSRAVANAARTAGINLTLLECAYHRNGFNQSLKPEQARFGFHSVDDFLSFQENARAQLSDENTRVGLAIHSVRAVPEDWFLPINERALKNRMPLHIHASEQRAEVEACVSHRGCSPIALLNQHHLLAPHITLVHATHLIDNDARLIGEALPNICICASTEKNLGDGIIPLQDLHDQSVSICIGTDQHVRLDPFEEARSLEELERLRQMRRLILNQPGAYLYEALLPCLTTNGLRSLSPDFDDSTLINLPATLIAVELPPEYQWHGPEAALDAILLAAQPAKIKMVITNGHIVVQEGKSLFPDKNLLIKEIGKFFRKINLA